MDDFTTDRQDRNARLMTYIIAAIVALAFVLQRFAPPTPAQPGTVLLAAPTPYVVETQRIEVLSNNRFCVGVFEHC